MQAKNKNSKPKPKDNIATMDDFFNHHFNSNTVFIESLPPQRIPIHRVEAVIQNGLNNRASSNPNYQTPTIEAAIIQNIIETGQNLYKSAHTMKHHSRAYYNLNKRTYLTQNNSV